MVSNQTYQLLHREPVSSVAQLCPAVCDPMDCSTPGFPAHHQLPELAQTHDHQVSDAIQPSHPLSSPTTNKTKRKSKDWDKIFANDAIHKGLISKTYNIMSSYSSVTTTKNEQLNQNTHTHLAKRHTKRCLTALVIREMQSKTTVRHYLTLVRMAITKSLQIVNAEEGVKGM